MPKTTFFIRPNKDKNNTHSLYCRVTYNKTKTEFSTGEKVIHSEWDQDNQKINSTKRKETYIETLLETLSYNLKTIALMNDYLTAKDLVNHLKRKNRKTPSLVSMIEDYINEVKPRIKTGTLRNHEIKLENLKEYQKDNKAEFNSQTFNLVEAEKYKKWFMWRAKTENVDTANRNILFFKQAMQFACKMGKIKSFDLVIYKGEKDKVKPPVFLTVEDLTVLEQHSFKNIMLIQIKDLFLFQCYTGLSFGDIWSKWQVKEVDTGKILTGERTKNNQSFFIPMDQRAVDILERYNFNLPRYCNEVYNRILKEIAALCGIDKRLTSHVGRKTFATLKDSEGWSRETVASMLGHKSVKTTEIYYLGASTTRIENEMRKRS